MLADEPLCLGPMASDLTEATEHTHDVPQICHFQNQQIRNERLQSIRKAKSRNAARTRRGKENYEFYELAKLLPIPQETSSQLDKASIIRLTMSYLKVREFALNGHPPWNTSFEGPPPNRTVKDMSSKHREHSTNSLIQSYLQHFEQNLGTHLLQSLDGFMFALNCDGKFIYVSESISMHLGLSQVELIGSSMFDYTYPADQDELAVQLGLTLSPALSARAACSCMQLGSKCSECAMVRSFHVRLKSTLTRRGVNVKSSCYKVVHLCTRPRMPHVKRGKTKKYVSSQEVKSEKSTNGLKVVTDGPLGVFGIGTSLPPQSLSDMSLDKPVFVTRLNPAFKFTYCDTAIESLLGYSVREVVGQSFYHKVHAEDVDKLKKCHAAMLHKGQLRTPYYRWLHKSGGYVWMHSCVTVLANQRLYPEESFIWINYTISEHIDEGEQLDLSQSELPSKSVSDSNATCEPEGLTAEVHDDDSKHLLRKSDNHKGVACPSHAKRRESTSVVPSTESLEDGSLSTEAGTEEGDEQCVCIIDVGGSQPRKHSCTDADPVLKESYLSESSSSNLDNKTLDSGQTDAIPEACTSRGDTPSDAKIVSSSRRSISDTGTAQAASPPRKRRHSLARHSSAECEKAQVIKSTADFYHKSSTEEFACEDENAIPQKIPCVAASASSDSSTRAVVTQSISEYLDTDSLVWKNPPNREISNHNDLPPGIKQMHGACTVRHTPSAVHHHYPFGINPGLLHSNPLLAKIMMAGWGRCRPHFQPAGPCIVANPIPLLSTNHVPLFGGSQGMHNLPPTPASVAAVLEELKKDPLHKISPPNKVVMPNLEGSGKISSKDGLILTSASLDEQLALAAASCDGETSSNGQRKKYFADMPQPASLAAESVAVFAGNIVNQHIKEQTLLQVPNSLLIPSNTMLVHSSDSPFVAIAPDSVIKLPISSTSFQKQINPCVLQSFTFPPVAEIPSVPL